MNAQVVAFGYSASSLGGALFESSRTVISAVMVLSQGLRNAEEWWEVVNHSPAWQDSIFHTLAALFGIIGIVALVCSLFDFGFDFFISLFFILKNSYQFVKQELSISI